MSIIKDGLILYRILTFFLVPDRIGESLEVNGTAGVLSALQMFRTVVWCHLLGFSGVACGVFNPCFCL